MALAKNRNKDTLVGLRAKSGTSTPGDSQKLYGNESWVRRGAMSGNGRNVRKAKGFCTVRAGARRGVAVHHLLNPCAGVK